MRAVLDTNVLISGLLWKGAPHQCLIAAEGGLFELVSAESILEELKEKLVEKFASTPAEAEESVAGIRRVAKLVAIEGRAGWVAADPDDDKFIETALISSSDAIVSGDRHLQEIGTVEGIEVLSPREFIDRLAQASGPGT